MEARGSALPKNSIRVRPDGTRTETRYDAQGRRIAEIGPNGERTSYEYNEEGELSAVTLPEVRDPYVDGQKVRPRYEFSYDRYGNVVAVRDNLAVLPGGSIRVDHDPSDADADESRTRRRDHDPVGAIVARELPNGLAEQFGYGDNGRRDEHVDLAGRTEQIAYNSLGRLTERAFFGPNADPATDPADQRISFSRNEIGQLTRVESPAGTADYTRDADGRLLERETPRGTIHYRYDASGQLAEMRLGPDPSAPEFAVSYAYDEQGRLSTLTVTAADGQWLSKTQQRVTEYGYDPATGRIAVIERPNDLVTVMDYEDLGRIERIEHLEADGTPDDFSDNPVVSTFAYTYTDAGELASETERRPSDFEATTTWSYDGAGRVVEETYDATDDSLDYRTQYGYDLVGNRIEKRHSPDGDSTFEEVTTYAYDANDRLTERVRSEDGTAVRRTTYAYEGGERTEKTVKNLETGELVEEVDYSYNARGRLAETVTLTYDSSTLAEEETIRYTYNHRGLRVAKERLVDQGADGDTDTHTRTAYLYDTKSPSGRPTLVESVQENILDSSAAPRQRHFVVGHDTVGQLTTQGGTTERLTLLADAQGSTRILADATGSVIQRIDYTAFGELLTDAEPATPVLFQSEPRDADTGLNYHRARWYDPETGGFTRPDPVRGIVQQPQTFQPYAFGRQDPVNRMDPSGEFSVVSVAIAQGIRTGLGAIYSGYVAGAGFAAAAAGRELITAHSTLLNTLAQRRSNPEASVLVHGVAGPLNFKEPGWSTGFQQDLTNLGLTNNDFVEFTWSGFDIVGLGVVPQRSIHGIAVNSLEDVLTATHAKGYGEVNVAAHSWGTTISFAAIDDLSLGANNWATFGSPLKATAPTPSHLEGSWIDFFSDSDPVTGFEMFPPFSRVPARVENAFNNAARRVNAFQVPRHGMEVPVGGSVLAGLTQEHGAYWTDPVVLNAIAFVFS